MAFAIGLEPMGAFDGSLFTSRHYAITLPWSAATACGTQFIPRMARSGACHAHACRGIQMSSLT